MRAPAIFIVLACAAGAACSASELRTVQRAERGTPLPASGIAASVPRPPVAEAPPPVTASAPRPSDVAVPVPVPVLEFEVPAPEALHEATPEYSEPSLTSIARQTFVFAKPSFKSQKIGYLRVGAVVSRSKTAVGSEACKRGWYRVQPEGYVCIENSAVLDTEGESPYAHLATVRPDRMAPLPYRYGRSRYPTPPFYTRLPSKLDQERSEQELTGHLRARTAEAWKSVPNDPTPAELLEGKSVPMPWGFFREGNPLTTGRGMPDSGFALLGIYEHEGRRFALNTDFQLIPVDRLKPVEPSTFHGIKLDDSVTLPVVFVRSGSAHLYAGDPKKTGLSIARKLAYREAVPITGREVIVSGIHYLETKTGDWLRDERLVRIDKFKNKPGWASPNRSWIHVSILQQSLVMYSGEKPVYATLVSTGVDGLGDPLETRSTIRGQFLVHTKHVSVTMDSEAEGDEFDLRDVPYVQYFQDGYALHAAFWHDSFGQPYSHGCVNLSPLDARALFHMTEPPVPQTWHGAMSLSAGTLVHITP
ncbi:MAG TPA: L,D-transpeptidase [Polyangiaceae bacterium]|nr:L,D-transpeptidase [Polyangiaceae bacterium]